MSDALAVTVNNDRVLGANSWRRQLILGLLPLLAGFGMLAGIVFVPLALKGNADFRQFYAGGYIMRTGLRHGLYDSGVQRDVENRVVSNSTQVLPVNHPAYEYVFLAPLSLLPYRQAYFAWAALNTAVMVFCGIRIARSLNDGWLALALVAGFTPVWGTLMHGQDSIWLLFFCLLSFESRDEFTAGALLGMTAFRFHLLIPVLVLYVLWRRWRFLKGALLTSGVLAAISVWLVGIQESWLYVRSAAMTTEVRKGLPVNLYGLAQAVVGPRHPHTALLIAGTCATAALWYACRQKPSLDLALLVIPLASYHLLLHDLVILLIPISRRIRESSAAILQFLLPALGFTPLAFVSGTPSALMLIGTGREQ
jgi:hypothetical protein